MPAKRLPAPTAHDRPWRDRGARTFGGLRHQSLPTQAREALLAAVLPRLRGLVSSEKRVIGTVEASERVLEFVNSHDAPRLAELGTSCPDHFLRTKIKPLYVAWRPEQGEGELLELPETSVPDQEMVMLREIFHLD